LKAKSTKTVIFTDLDGTLLDEKYDYQDIKPIIDKLLVLNASIVFCSSKTKAEIEFYRKEMRINDPFISENGSAIFIPKGYFSVNYMYTKQTSRYNIVELGIAYSMIRKKMGSLKARFAGKIIGFGDMTHEEIAKDSGLPLNLTKLARRREYSEPFRIVEGDEKEIFLLIREQRLSYTKGGRYFHLIGNSNKGKAVAILKDLYSETFSKLITFGIGNSPNDLSMLKVTDMPILMRETPKKRARCTVWKNILDQVGASKIRRTNR